MQYVGSFCLAKTMNKRASSRQSRLPSSPLQKYHQSSLCYVRIANAAFEAGDRANTIKYCREAEKKGLYASEGATAFAEEGGDGFEDFVSQRSQTEGVLVSYFLFCLLTNCVISKLVDRLLWGFCLLVCLLRGLAVSWFVGMIGLFFFLFLFDRWVVGWLSVFVW